jgi:hypothetical protein
VRYSAFRVPLLYLCGIERVAKLKLDAVREQVNSTMNVPKKPIRLTPELDSLLSQLYDRKGIPRDQYKHRQKDSAEFAWRWHKLSGRDDTVEELVRYMKNQQKDKQGREKRGLPPWPTFDGAHKRRPAPDVVLDKEQLEVLRQLYGEMVVPLGIGVDLVEADVNLCKALSKEFAKQTGLIVPGTALVGIAEDKRKRGLWFRVGRGGVDRGIDFSDMDKLKEIDDSDGA